MIVTVVAVCSGAEVASSVVDSHWSADMVAIHSAINPAATAAASQQQHSENQQLLSSASGVVSSMTSSNSSMISASSNVNTSPVSRLNQNSDLTTKVSASQSKGRWFKTQNDPCLLIEAVPDQNKI